MLKERFTAENSVILILACAVFSTALFPSDFLYDGVTVIKNNPSVTGATSWYELFTSSYWGFQAPSSNYRPLTLATFRLEYTWLGFGNNPSFYLLTNILLHAFVSLLVFRLGFTVFKTKIPAFLGSILFAVHPVSSSVVPNLVGRADLLATAFLIVSMLSWIRRRSSDGPFWLVVSGISWFAALLSKESAAVAPLLFPVIDFAIKRGSQRMTGRFPKLLRDYAVLLSIGGLWLILRTSVLGGVLGQIGRPELNPLLFVDPEVRVFTAFKVLGLYFWKTIAPFHLSTTYAYNQIPMIHSPFSLEFYLACLFLGAVLYGMYRLLTVSRSIFACGLLYWIPVLLVSNLIVSPPEIMATRFLYLPLVGFSLALGGTLHTVTENLPPRRKTKVLVTLGLLLVAAYGTRTLIRNPIWKSELAFYKAQYRDAPKSITGNANFAGYLTAHTDSRKHLKMAYRLSKNAVILSGESPGPTPIGPYMNYGQIILKLHELHNIVRPSGGEKLKHFLVADRAIRSQLTPGNIRFSYEKYGGFYFVFGKVNMIQGKWKEAKKAFERSYSFKKDPAVLANWGRVLTKLGEPEKAVKSLEKAIEHHQNPKWKKWLSEAKLHSKNE